MTHRVNRIIYSRSGRARVFFDGRSEPGSTGRQPIITSPLLISRYAISRDSEINDSEYDSFVRDSALFHALDYCLRILARFSYTLKRLGLKMKQKGFTGPVIRLTLDKLEQMQVVNEGEQIKAVITDLQKRNYSHLQIRQRLLARGFTADLIDSRLAEDTEQETEKCRALVAKKTRHGRREKQKLWQFLARRGFSSDTIRAVITDDGAGVDE